MMPNAIRRTSVAATFRWPRPGSVAAAFRGGRLSPVVPSDFGVRWLCHRFCALNSSTQTQFCEPSVRDKTFLLPVN